MELVNSHVHTHFSGHGNAACTPMAVAQAALEAGITTLVFAEHYPLTRSLDPNLYISMVPEVWEEYLEEIERVKREFPQMEILTGMELDWLGDQEDRAIGPDTFGSCQAVLTSCHYVDGWAFDLKEQRGAWDEPGAVDRIWSRYVDVWCDAALSSWPIDVMAHPDLAKKFGHRPSFDLAPLYDRMAQAAAEGGRMVEVNTSGTLYACQEMFPSPALLRKFCEAGVPCTVGTDAHVPQNVARDIECGYRLMYEAGYREVTVLTASGDRRTISL